MRLSKGAGVLLSAGGAFLLIMSLMKPERVLSWETPVANNARGPLTAQARERARAEARPLIVDFTARQKVGGLHLTLGILQQLPILPPSAYAEADLAFIVPRVLELTYTSHAMAPFARDLGYEGAPFTWDEGRRARLRAELDAWYALAYGLSRDELRYVLDPKDVMGADYPSETFRVLQKNEIAKYGEYRTQRLVLAAYDTQVAAARDAGLSGRTSKA